jgi:predicted metal-dependent HD superfamily phosphohydrolase
MVSPERLESMRASWVKLLERYAVSPRDAHPPFDALVAAYSTPERHYHNLEHLGEMFRVAARLAADTPNPDSVQLAIWFHDAVYDPRAKNNEARSGELAANMLEPLGVPVPVIDRVVAMIQATAHLASAEPPGDRDTAALLDADLAILGASAERYRRYAADIRKEYAWVADADYRKGRAAVLKMFLARPRIYFNTILFEEGEAQARENMTAELNALVG